MIDKQFPSVAEAVADIPDGATVMIGGFGASGSPIELIHALIDHGAGDLTVINNNTGNGEVGLAALIGHGQVRKMICSFPRSSQSRVFPKLYKAGRIELELVPQGTLAERIRAAGAGIPAFFTPTTVGTVLAEGKEIREFDGRPYVMEPWLKADFALVKCEVADHVGEGVGRVGFDQLPRLVLAQHGELRLAARVTEPGERTGHLSPYRSAASWYFWRAADTELMT